MSFGPGLGQSSTPPTHELGRALDVLVAGGAEETHRDEIARFVAAARGRRQPPEEVLVLLKDELRRHAMPHLDQESYRALSERVVHWAIDEYYRAR
jgi:hypothetical protein